jgi:hypothetical protein
MLLRWGLLLRDRDGTLAMAHSKGQSSLATGHVCLQDSAAQRSVFCMVCQPYISSLDYALDTQTQELLQLCVEQRIAPLGERLWQQST